METLLSVQGMMANAVDSRETMTLRPQKRIGYKSPHSSIQRSSLFGDKVLIQTVGS